MLKNAPRPLILIACACAIFWPGAFIFGLPGVLRQHWQLAFGAGGSAVGGTVFFTEGDDIPIRVNASDPDGSISKVEFYANFIKLGQDTDPGYEFVSKNVPAGNYKVSVLAYDNEGATTASSINIIVLPK